MEGKRKKQTAKKSEGTWRKKRCPFDVVAAVVSRTIKEVEVEEVETKTMCTHTFNGPQQSFSPTITAAAAWLLVHRIVVVIITVATTNSGMCSATAIAVCADAAEAKGLVVHGGRGRVERGGPARDGGRERRRGRGRDAGREARALAREREEDDALDVAVVHEVVHRPDRAVLEERVRVGRRQVRERLALLQLDLLLEHRPQVRERDRRVAVLRALQRRLHVVHQLVHRHAREVLALRATKVVVGQRRVQRRNQVHKRVVLVARQRPAHQRARAKQRRARRRQSSSRLRARGRRGLRQHRVLRGGLRGLRWRKTARRGERGLARLHDNAEPRRAHARRLLRRRKGAAHLHALVQLSVAARLLARVRLQTSRNDVSGALHRRQPLVDRDKRRQVQVFHCFVV